MFASPDWGIAACEDNTICPPPLSFTFWTMGTITVLTSTFVMGPPLMARSDTGRNIMMWVFGNVARGFGTCEPYLHGVGVPGYLMHYTAEKMLRHNYIKKADLQCTFAIVRNPYSRMVSIFLYNKRHPCESFLSFVHEWNRKLKKAQDKGSTEEVDVYCHVLPMVDFTHFQGVQLVPFVIKQENLGKEDFGVGSGVLPAAVSNALSSMPHRNKRKMKKDKSWKDYYTPEIRDMVYDMYKADFETFDYSPEISTLMEPHISAKIVVFEDGPSSLSLNVAEV